jgi:ATP-dependent Clp endopeptidase proteolytic subunit ClpP
MTWYKISAKAGAKRAKINIHSEIARPWFDGEDVVGARRFIADLDALDVEDIDLHINSPGGEVFEGLAIYNALKDHPARVHVQVDGVAASIASVVAMAGDDIVMPKTAMMMIHDPYGFAAGTAADMQSMAATLEKVKGTLVAAYAERARADEERIVKMMSEETWLTAEEAVALGLADEVLPAARSAKAYMPAHFWNSYRNIPNKFKPAANRQPDNPDPADDAGPDTKECEMEFKELSIDLLVQNRSDLVAKIEDTARGAAVENILALAEVHFGAEAGESFRKIVAAGVSASGYAAIKAAQPPPAPENSAEKLAMLAAIQAAGAPGVGADLPPAGGDKPFEVLVAEHMAANPKAKKSAAMQAVQQAHPAAYDAWLAGKQRK